MDSVVVKSYSHGITLILDPDADFKTILEETTVKFDNTADFFKGGKLALAIKGKELTEIQKNLLIDVLTMHGKVNICCLVEEDEKTDEIFSTAIARVPQSEKSDLPITIVRGDVTGEKTIESGKSIIVLGNVEKGCKLISAHDIIVSGQLWGDAFAGIDTKESHYVAAYSIRTENIEIADCKPSVKKFRRKKKPQIALVRNGEVELSLITEELLNDMLKDFLDF